MNKNKEVFWTVLPRFMTIAGLNQTELAQAVGVSKSTVNCWIKRKSFPEMDTIQRIADVLGIRTDDLLIEIPENHAHAAEDMQIQKLWPLAPIHAKRAAIAVLLQLMKDEEEEVLGIDLSKV
jgi:repressor LexA